jgi:excisionase family DNA binding protein
MNISNFRAEEYAIVIQVFYKSGIGYLSGYQPDFDYRVIEPYRPNDVGQAEMMMIKIRREIAARAKSPSPTPPKKSAKLLDIPERNNLTPRDVARRLNLSEMTVRRLADEGSIKCAYTPKGHRRFSESEIERFIESQKNTRGSSPSSPHSPTLSARMSPDSEV